MLGFLDLEIGRDVGFDSRAGRLGVPVDQAVTAVRQNPALTARDSAHGEITTIDQPADHARGDAQKPCGPGSRSHWQAAWNVMSLAEEVSSSTGYEMFARIVTKYPTLQPHSCRLCCYNIFLF